MEWWQSMLIIFGGLVVLFATGLPVALSFLGICLIGILLWWGGPTGISNLFLSMHSSVGNFVLTCIPLFILMGEMMMRSGTATTMISAVDDWIGRVPGRLGLTAVAGGTLFATMSGSSIASVIVLGELLVPKMEKQGYKKEMALGPIMGSGVLAVMIPPSSYAIFIGALSDVSIGGLLMAIIVPGLLLAALFAAYVIVRCRLQPSLAPAYDVSGIPLSRKLINTVRYILPLGFIIFLVIGCMLLGVATPTESAASGALGTFILAAAYRRLNWKVVKESLVSTAEITIMIFLILAGATAFSQILASSGASQGFIGNTMQLPVAPVGIVLCMILINLLLGCFISTGAVIMICIPIFMPIILALGFNPIWFNVIFLLAAETGGLTPPFGLLLFAMQKVAHVTFGDCVKAATPFVILDIIAILLIVAFPPIALWLPGQMR